MKIKKIPIIIASVFAGALVCGGGYLYVQSENAKAAAALVQQEQVAAEKAEFDKLAAKKAEADKVVEKAVADKLEADKAVDEKTKTTTPATPDKPKSDNNSYGVNNGYIDNGDGTWTDSKTGQKKLILDENGNIVGGVVFGDGEDIGDADNID